MTDEEKPGSVGQVFRAPIRSRTVETASQAGVRRAIATGKVGIGEPLSEAPADIEDAVLMTALEHGQRNAHLLTRFASVPANSLVWTRVDEDSFRLGSRLGGWSYDDSDEALALGITNVRPILWLDEEFGLLDTPAAVARTFERGGRNFQRIRDREAESITGQLWDELAGDRDGG